MGILGLALSSLINSADAADTQMRPDGRDAFTTQVTGYMTTENPTASEAEMMDASHQPAAFFTVLSFKDAKFRDQLLSQISAGNSLNQVDGKGHVQFRLGCFVDKKIESESMVLPDQAKLLSASAMTPVTIELTFKKGVSGGWECSSFADGLSVVDTRVSDISGTVK